MKIITLVLSSLTAISPVDGRYRNKTENLSSYFSEYALIQYRVRIEIEYFIALCNSNMRPLPSLTKTQIDHLRAIYNAFNPEDAEFIKKIERTTNHDVKAVEYFVKEKLSQFDLDAYAEFIHFGLTSQDINNTAIPLSIKEALEQIMWPMMEDLINKVGETATILMSIPMLAHTHGQPASPTGMGKEWMVFHERLTKQLSIIKSIEVEAKFGGATGNFNAHVSAYPAIDWRQFANAFVGSLGLKRQQYTTQIEHYDTLSSLFDAIRRFNVILVDFSRDIWQYISMDYFKQKVIAGEVGSSAMPHKVNPIDFENAEGNLLLANSILEFLSHKLPVSRLQRDLTDSTVLRNVGMPFAHSIIAYQSLLKGISKLVINKEALHHDLDNNWAVVAEGIQTILRREQYPQPYEALKALTRHHHKITQQALADFIDSLDIHQNVKDELKQLTPHNYTGYATGN